MNEKFVDILKQYYLEVLRIRNIFLRDKDAHAGGEVKDSSKDTPPT